MIDADFTFDPAAHVYTHKGARVPSVTQVTDHLNDYSMVSPAVLRAKAELGTAVHKATELHDLDDLDEDSLDPRVVPYLEAWKRFRTECSPEILMMETPLSHKTYGYAGTQDRVVRLHKVIAILDLKTTASLMPAVGPQTAAYQELYNSNAPSSLLRATHRFAVQLRENGTYRLEEYADRHDWVVFLACLTIHKFKEKHR